MQLGIANDDEELRRVLADCIYDDDSIEDGEESCDDILDEPEECQQSDCEENDNIIDLVDIYPGIESHPLPAIALNEAGMLLTWMSKHLFNMYFYRLFPGDIPVHSPSSVRRRSSNRFGYSDNAFRLVPL